MGLLMGFIRVSPEVTGFIHFNIRFASLGWCMAGPLFKGRRVGGNVLHIHVVGRHAHSAPLQFWEGILCRMLKRISIALSATYQFGLHNPPMRSSSQFCSFDRIACDSLVAVASSMSDTGSLRRIPSGIVMDGLASQWEASEEVRSRLRENRRLFVSTEKNDFEPPCHCREAALNKEILIPLLKFVKSTRQPDGSHGLFKIADVEKQKL